MSYPPIPSIKSQVQILRSSLKEIAGFELKHAHALEAVAKMYGLENWNALSALAPTTELPTSPGSVVESSEELPLLKRDILHLLRSVNPDARIYIVDRSNSTDEFIREFRGAVCVVETELPYLWRSETKEFPCQALIESSWKAAGEFGEVTARDLIEFVQTQDLEDIFLVGQETLYASDSDEIGHSSPPIFSLQRSFGYEVDTSLNDRVVFRLNRKSKTYYTQHSQPAFRLFEGK